MCYLWNLLPSALDSLTTFINTIKTFVSMYSVLKEYCMVEIELCFMYFILPCDILPYGIYTSVSCPKEEGLLEVEL